MGCLALNASFEPLTILPVRTGAAPRNRRESGGPGNGPARESFESVGRYPCPSSSASPASSTSPAVPPSGHQHIPLRPRQLPMPVLWPSSRGLGTANSSPRPRASPARGGDNTWQNVVTACSPCNNRKASHLPRQLRHAPAASAPSSRTTSSWCGRCGGSRTCRPSTLRCSMAKTFCGRCAGRRPTIEGIHTSRLSGHDRGRRHRDLSLAGSRSHGLKVACRRVPSPKAPARRSARPGKEHLHPSDRFVRLVLPLNLPFLALPDPPCWLKSYPHISEKAFSRSRQNDDEAYPMLASGRSAAARRLPERSGKPGGPIAYLRFSVHTR